MNALPLKPAGGTTQPGDLPKAFSIMKETSYTHFQAINPNIPKLILL